MYEDLFDSLVSKNDLMEKVLSICEGMTWEQIARALYSILDDIDTASDICKENLQAYQDLVCSIQTKRFQYMNSPDGFRLEPSVTIEEVDTAVMDPEEKLKANLPDSLNKELTRSSYPGKEGNWLKFWLLTDGTIVPVNYSHDETAHDGSVKYSDLMKAGALGCHINKTDEDTELSITGSKTKLTSKQISALKHLYDKYFITDVYLDINPSLRGHGWVDSSRSFVNFLITGKGRERKPWESKVSSEKVGGWIHPDGKIKYFDNYFEEAHWMDAYKHIHGGELPKKISSKILQDARAASVLYMKKGYIRFVQSSEDLNIEVLSKPTVSQMRSLSRLVKGSEYFIADVEFGDMFPETENSWESFRKLVSTNESITDFARGELETVGLFDKDSDYEGMLGEAVMELISTFANQGHSGYSAILDRELFDKLSNWKPLTELTDNPDEWMEVSEMCPEDQRPVFQSRRSPSCFSNDGGKTYYDLDEMGEDGTKKIHTSKGWKTSD